MGQNLQRREVDSVRLDSWKEIAAFFNRDTRTVRRWENDRDLPVHRVPGGERSGVFAYVSELEAWLRAPNSYSRTAPSHAAPQKIASILTPSITAPLVAESVQESIAVDITESPTSFAPVDPPAEERAAQCSDETPQHPAAAISALHLLNTYDGTFTAAVESDFAPPSTRQTAVPESPHQAPSSFAFANSKSLSRRLGGSLLLMLAASIAVAMVYLHIYQPRASAHRVHKVSPEAQDLYLRGRYEWNLRTEDGILRAIDLFTQSIVHDPQYAPAYAGLADSYLLLRQYGHMPDSEAYPRALAAARQGIALDDSSPDAHRALAFILRFWDFDMAAAERDYRRAIALDPANSQSHHWFATALLSSGRGREALAEIDLARSLEPQSISVLADRGIILYSVDPKAGIAALQQLEQSEPAFLSTHVYLADIYLAEGIYDRFLTETRITAGFRHDTNVLAFVDRANDLLASRGSVPMLRQFASDLAPLADRSAVQAYTVARLFSLAGEPQQSLRYLRLSFDRRESYILNIDRDPTLADLHSLPDYQTLSRKIGGTAVDEQFAIRSIPRTF